MRRFHTLSAALALTLGLAACNGDQAAVEEDPAGALRDAVSALAEYDGIELTMSIDGDREAAAAAIDAGDLTEDELELLTESSIVVRAAGTDETDAEVQFVVNLRGTEVADVRLVEGSRFFFRVDIDAIATEVDDPSISSDLDGLVGMGEMFGLGEAATSLREGDWIELTGTDQLMNMFEQQAGAEDGEVSEEEAEQIQQRVAAAFERFVQEDAQVSAVGSEDAGERVRVQASGEDVQALLLEIQSIAGEVGNVPTEDLEAELGEIGDVTFDAWIDGGELSQVGIDIAQFDETGETPSDEVFILIGIAEFSGGVEVPSDATAVDLFEIVGGFMGGGMGGGLGDDPFADDAGEDPFADDAGEDPFGDDAGADPAADCVPQEELDQLADVLSEEEFAEFEALIDAGLIEVC